MSEIIKRDTLKTLNTAGDLFEERDLFQVLESVFGNIFQSVFARPNRMRSSLKDNIKQHWGATPQSALAVARRLCVRQVDINVAPFNPAALFGGFGKSGIGRESGRYGIEKFLAPVSIQWPPSYFKKPESLIGYIP